MASIQVSTFWFFLLCLREIFSCYFKKYDFEGKILLSVRFWIEKIITRQILEDKKTKRQILEFFF